MRSIEWRRKDEVGLAGIRSRGVVDGISQRGLIESSYRQCDIARQRRRLPKDRGTLAGLRNRGGAEVALSVRGRGGLAYHGAAAVAEFELEALVGGGLPGRVADLQRPAALE